MDKKELIAAIISGNKQDLENVLPKVIILSHTEIEKAVLWLCENDLPPGAAFNWEPRLHETDVPRVLKVFDNFFLHLHDKMSTAYAEMDKADKDLFDRLYSFIGEHYTTYIEAGKYEELSSCGDAWKKRTRIQYRPYYN